MGLIVVLAMVAVAGLVVVAVARGGDGLGLAHGLWGLLTLFVFMPAGAVLALVLTDHAPIAAVLCGFGAASGLFVAFAMLTAAFRGPASSRPWLGEALVAHHLLILAIFGSVPWLERGAPDLAWPALLAVPCGIGIALGLATRRVATIRTRSIHTLEGGSHV